MTLRDQIEARTNAAITSAVWKHLMSQMRRGRGGCCWLLWWLKSWNGLANKLQNVMLSKTRTNGMYSNSAAWARGTRVQSPKREEILRWNT